MSFIFDGANDRLTASLNSAYAGVPMTIACYFKVTNHPVATHTLMNFGASSSSASDSQMLRSTATDDQWGILTTDSGGTSNAATVSSINVDGVWAGYLGKFTSATRRDVYVKALANTGSNTTNRVVGNMQHLRLGETLAGANDYLGRIAEVAIWTSALADADINSYMLGRAAQRISPSTLVGYWPLKVSGDLANRGTDGTTNLTAGGNAAFDSDHPVIFTSNALPFGGMGR